MRVSTVLVGFVLLAACSKPPSTPPPTSEPAPVTDPVDTGTPDVDAENGGEQRPGITAADCEAQGGQVVGDIGDGAIHQPDYRCPTSGEAPIGTITPDPGGPVAVEGSVCCK
jgi:hypothetical protein